MVSAVTAPAVLGTFPIFAHQGGWDEALLVATPLAVIGGLLWLANRRVKQQLEAQASEGASSSSASPPSTSPPSTSPPSTSERPQA